MMRISTKRIRGSALRLALALVPGLLIVTPETANAQQILTLYEVDGKAIISRDGSLVAGRGGASSPDFLIDSEGQLTILPSFRRVRAVSGDGSILALSDQGEPALSIDGNDTPLPEIGPGFGGAAIFDISGDGNTLAGSVIENGGVLRALIYDRPSQTYTILAPAVPYGDFEIPLQFNHLEAISTDGSTLVGQGNDLFEPLAYEAIKVDPGGLVEYLGVTDFSQDPPIDFAWASATNADGTVIVGNRARLSDPNAFEPWRLEGGVITPLAARGLATSVTDNGDRVAGSACFAWPCSKWRDEDAFYWTEETGLEDFAKVLEEEWGVDLGGWRLLEISDMSDDGLVLGGRAMNPEGELRFFLARLPQTVEMKLLPEPATTLGLLLGGAMLSALKRRRDPGARRPAGSR